MQMRKAEALIIAVLFLMSSLAVFTGAAQGEGQFVDDIRFEVRASESTGISDTATGDLDVFLQPVSDVNWFQDRWKSNLGTWKTSESYQNMYLNPVHDKDTGLPVVNVSGQYEFNPFGIREVRFAVNHLMNRKHIVEDIYSYYANPRYTALEINSPGYEQYFDSLIDDIGLTYSGDFQEGYELVQSAMKDVRDKLDNDTSLYGMDYGELRLQESSSDAGENNKWEYRPPGGDFSTVEIISRNRLEDERLQIGHYFTDQMAKVGFKTTDDDLERIRAMEQVFYSDADDLEWNAYTGGWLERGASRYQEKQVNRMYAPWYENMPSAKAGSNAWQYENETLDNIGKRLVNGEVANKTAYWDMMRKMIRTGVKESVRVFLSTSTEFYVYNSDRVANVATDPVTGWSSLFGPRTLRIDGDNSTKWGQYSSTGALYEDNWNRIGGSGDKYSEQQQDVVRDRATETRLSTGKPMPMRADWNVQKDFTWDNDEKQKNLTVPDSAVRYDTESEEWKQVGSGKKSAVSVTYTWKKNENGALGTWHDGSPMHERDILAWYAFSKELSYDNGGDYHVGQWASINKPWFDSITALKWGEDDGTYTIYGNYTFPADEKIGSYYGITPYKPWEINEAAQQMVANGSVAASSSDSWGWTDTAENWIHFIGKQQCEKFNTTMENMVNQGWIPDYLKQENNCPLPITPNEMEREIENITSFYQEYDHMFDSQGPFKLTNVDLANMFMEMERHTTSDGYPFSKNYWESRSKVLEFEMGTPDVPSSRTIGEDIPVEVNQCRIIESYPINSERLADTGDVAFSLFKSGEKIVEVEGKLTENGTFIGTIPGSATADLIEGVYSIKITGEASGSMPDTVSETILLTEPKMPVVQDLQVTPTSGRVPLDIFVEAVLNNPTSSPVDIPIKIGGERIGTFNVSDNSSRKGVINHTINQAANYTVDVGDSAENIDGRSTYVNVTDTPGIEVTDLNVWVSGFNLTINAAVENSADESRSVHVEVGAKMGPLQTVDTVTLDAQTTTKLSVPHLVSEKGIYKVQVGNKNSLVNVTGTGGPQFELVKALNVSSVGLELAVTAQVRNTGQDEGTVHVWADGIEIGNKTVAPGETRDFNFTYRLDSKGQYDISIREDQGDILDEKTADVQRNNQEDLSLFLLLILGISVLTAILVFMKKGGKN